MAPQNNYSSNIKKITDHGLKMAPMALACHRAAKYLQFIRNMESVKHRKAKSSKTRYGSNVVYIPDIRSAVSSLN